MTVIGPLTTTFRAPSSCTTTTPQLYQVWSGSVSSYVEGPIYTSGSGSDCFPSGYDAASSNYYSPGWCPAGYTTACSSLASARTETDTETAVICCPTHFRYTCLAPSQGQPSLGCTTTWTSALAVLGVTVVTDSKIASTTVVSETSNGITAYGVQVRFKAGDPTAAAVGGDSTNSVATPTTAPAVSIPTQLLVPAQTSSPPSGLGTPAIIGTAVGSAVAALLIAGALGFFFLRWRRKRRRQRPSLSPPPVPPKDLPASRTSYRKVPPPYELSEDVSPRRPSMSVSKRHLSMSPVSARSPTEARIDSDVLGAYRAAVELAADSPTATSLRDRASPESASSGWTDRQARGATMPTPWL